MLTGKTETEIDRQMEEEKERRTEKVDNKRQEKCAWETEKGRILTDRTEK